VSLLGITQDNSELRAQSLRMVYILCILRHTKERVYHFSENTAIIQVRERADERLFKDLERS